MKALGWMPCLFLALFVAPLGWCQATVDQNSTTDQKTVRQETVKTKKSEPGPGREVANGTGNVAGGAAKGAGDVAKGVGKGAADLATLHPIDAGVAVGRGAGGAAKDVTVGTVKGTGKITKGVGRAIKKIL